MCLSNRAPDGSIPDNATFLDKVDAVRRKRFQRVDLSAAQ
jgi:hypothetical protein